MAGICESATRDQGGSCEHLTLGVRLDGVLKTIKTGFNDPQWADALSDEEVETMLRLLARWWKGKGADLASFVGRVLAGEEGTNMKSYLLLAKDVTKTNIGTSYVNVPPGANGERTLVEFTACTEFRIKVHGVLAGTGQYQMRVVRDSDDAVLYESGNIAAQAGEREFDTGILPLPAPATGFIDVRFQAKGSNTTDDPIFRKAVLYVR